MPAYVSPPSVAGVNRHQSSELRSERTSMRGTFGSRRRPPVVGVSDTVAYSTKILAGSARRAEKAWMKSLTDAEKSLLRTGRSLA
jgi:hypothetical protein